MDKLIFKTEGFVDSEKPENYKSSFSFFIDEDFTSLTFELYGGGKPLYFHVTDPLGAVRLQFLGRHISGQTVLHESESKTGIGTCFGKIYKGTWRITVYTFGARCNSRLGKVHFSVKVFKENTSEAGELPFISWFDHNELERGRIILKGFEKPSIDNEYRWLKGDFHVHSCLSDGSANPHELLEEGRQKKLDFFFITEHGILTPSFPEKRGITVFPSYEVTTASGHFNLPGLGYMPDGILEKGPDPDWKDIMALMTEARDKGALISINHPLHYPWLWLYNDIPLSLIDSIEIISDPYADDNPDANDRTVKLLDLIWNEGYRISGVGGSDTHTLYSSSQLGQPVTLVYARPGSLNSMLNSIRSHNAAVFTDLDCILEYSTGGKILLPGTDVENNDDLDLEISFESKKITEPLFLRIVENGVTVDEIKIIQEGMTSVKRKWHGKSDWIRCELRDSKNMIRGYLNPLHRGRSKNSSIRTWGQLLDRIER